MKKFFLFLILSSLTASASPVDDLLLEFVKNDQNFLFNKRGLLSDRKAIQQNIIKADLKTLIKQYKPSKSKEAKNTLWRSIITEAATPKSRSILIQFMEDYHADYLLLDQDVISAVARVSGLYAFDLYSNGKLKAALSFLKTTYIQDPRFAGEIGFVKNFSILSYMDGDLKSSIEIVEKFNETALELDDSIQTILMKAKQAQRKAELKKRGSRF